MKAMSKSKEKIQSLDEAIKLVSDWAQTEKIVFTNGVFDLIHPGHVLYLEEAKTLGTKLIVGLNSDHSAKTLGKGAHRPINPLEARAIVLAGLQSVDLIVSFDDETPLELIENLRPNVLVKGGDYTLEQIIGSSEVLDNGGKVHSLSFLKGYSTTAIEQRILKAGLDQ
tara:strand:+ start:1244 stop:1747 length:504 start_codon:yes stop_codon:yes gene_type:complete